MWTDGGPRPKRSDTVRRAAAAGALFWAIHPLRVESVAWVTERRDVLSGCFCLGAVLAYLRMVRQRALGSRARGWYGVSVGLFLCSLASKSISIMLPAALLVLDWYPLGRWRREPATALAREKLPYLAVGAVFALLMLRAEHNIGALSLTGSADYSVVELFVQPWYRLLFYVGKTVWPLDLSPLYQVHLIGFPPPSKYPLSMLVVGVVTAVLVRRRERWQQAFVAWLGYLALILPMIGFVQVGPHFAADRNMYLPALAGAGLVASAVYAGVLRSGRWRGVTWTATLAALVVLGVLTYRQTQVWRDSITLWTHVIELDPVSPLAYRARGAARLETGDYRGAISDSTAALRITPASGEAYLTCAFARVRLGDLDGALSDCEQALAHGKDGWFVHSIQAQIYAERKDIERAIHEYDLALAASPEPFVAATLHLDRGNLHQGRGDRKQALADLDDAIAAAPDFAAAYNNRGTLRRDLGDRRAAVSDFDAAIRLGAASAETFANRGMVRQELGEREAAVEDFRRAMALAAPGWPGKDKVRQLLEECLRSGGSRP